MTPTWLETKVGAPPGPPPRTRLTEHARSTGMVLSALANKVTNKFKAFCKTELMDRFLHSCIEYFQAFFDLKKALAEVADEAAEQLNLQFTNGQNWSTRARADRE